MTPVLPPGFAVGHWTDRERWTGCTVVLPPPGATGSCEVRGGGPGTRETDVLSPASAAQGVHALLLAGGSAFGLAAADGVSRYLEERGIGFATSVARVPLVAAAVVYDLALGEPAHPGPDDGYAACAAAMTTVERGSVGAGTGCTVGKLLGPACRTKGGFGAASTTLLSGGATVTALAAVNALGEVVDETGEVVAGAWRDGAYVRSAEILRTGEMAVRPWREATTLVCVLTDVSLTKTQAWLVARAASAGVARAVVPSATPFDGDVAYCLAGGEAEADPLAVAALGAEVVAGAIRDAVRAATGAPACPAASERETM